MGREGGRGTERERGREGERERERETERERGWLDLDLAEVNVRGLKPGALVTGPPRWPSGKASASRAEDPGFESRLRRDFFGNESYQ